MRQDAESLLDPTTAERLVRLRALLQQAVAAASDQTAAGSHIAVVSLDGVAEQTTGLAAAEVGIAITEKMGFYGLIDRLTQALDRWDRGGLKGVRELHRARNNVQHHGVLPRVDHLPLWAADVEQFAVGLVRAAFGVELSSIAASQAITTPELRDAVATAEQALADGDYATAIREAMQGAEQVRRRFVHARGGHSTSMGNSIVDLKELQRGITAVQQLMDVVALTSDPAEWLWLQAMSQRLRRKQAEESSEPPTSEEARRAIVFVTSMALRLEAFARTYPGRDLLAPARRARAIDLTVDHPAPRIVDVRALPAQGREGRERLRVQLSDVPVGWYQVYREALRDWPESEGRLTASVFVDPTGRALIIEHPPVSADLLTAFIQQFVERVHARFRSLVEAHRRRKASDDVVLAEARRAFAGVGGVTVADAIERTGSDHIAVDVPGDVGAARVQKHLKLPAMQRGGATLLLSLDRADLPAWAQAIDEAVGAATADAQADDQAAEEAAKARAALADEVRSLLDVTDS